MNRCLGTYCEHKFGCLYRTRSLGSFIVLSAPFIGLEVAGEKTDSLCLSEEASSLLRFFKAVFILSFSKTRFLEPRNSLYQFHNIVYQKELIQNLSSYTSWLRKIIFRMGIIQVLFQLKLQLIRPCFSCCCEKVESKAMLLATVETVDRECFFDTRNSMSSHCAQEERERGVQEDSLEKKSDTLARAFSWWKTHLNLTDHNSYLSLIVHYGIYYVVIGYYSLFYHFRQKHRKDLDLSRHLGWGAAVYGAEEWMSRPLSFCDQPDLHFRTILEALTITHCNRHKLYVNQLGMVTLEWYWLPVVFLNTVYYCTQTLFALAISAMEKNRRIVWPWTIFCTFFLELLKGNNPTGSRVQNSSGILKSSITKLLHVSNREYALSFESSRVYRSFLIIIIRIRLSVRITGVALELLRF